MSKPMNSFLIYCQINRNKVKKEFPNRPNSEISAILGEKWRAMTTEAKEYYKVMAKNLKTVGKILLVSILYPF